MTYGLGILLREGLLFASDSRTNAGVDQIASVRKLASFAVPDERVLVVLSAGNLATTQAVIANLRAAFKKGGAGPDLAAVPSVFEATKTIGAVLRGVLAYDGEHVSQHGDPNASFIVGGQIAGDRPRLFQIYSAGNFVEGSPRTPFLQIGETKYGKPILDRALSYETALSEAAKLALLSFDATIRSNLSVAPPIDLLRYRDGSYSTADRLKLGAEHPYLARLRKLYSEGMAALVSSLPRPPDPEG